MQPSYKAIRSASNPLFGAREPITVSTMPEMKRNSLTKWKKQSIFIEDSIIKISTILTLKNVHLLIQQFFFPVHLQQKSQDWGKLIRSQKIENHFSQEKKNRKRS